MRVVGSVPALDGARRTAEDAEDHELLESIDGIRTLLLRNANVEKSQVVMVTSAVSGEGKTTLASHLATSLARAGRKTLLVDCDLRRPAAHQLFELPLQPGLSEALLNEVHIAEATLSTTVDGLWVVPAGQWDREVMHAIARGGIEEIFGKLKGEYEAWFKDVGSTRPDNYAPPRIVVGSPHEPTTVLTRQDWRGAGWGPADEGNWLVQIADGGPRDVKVIVAPADAERTIHIKAGSFSAQARLPAKATEHVFARQALPAGDQQLEAWIDSGGGRSGVRFVEIKRAL